MKIKHRRPSEAVIYYSSLFLIFLLFFFLILSIFKYKTVSGLIADAFKTQTSSDTPIADQNDDIYQTPSPFESDAPTAQPSVTPAPSPDTKDNKKSPEKSITIGKAVTAPTIAGDTSFSLSSDETNLSVKYNSPADVVEAVSSGVVGITSMIFDPLYNDYTAYGSGTGFIVSNNGYILTNAHVIAGAAKLEILFNDESSVDAFVVGYDFNTDIAVLKIDEARVLNVLTLGDSDKVRIGEYCLAIGNPLSSYSLYGTVSMGIVSGKAREINIEGFVNNYIQTDAALNPGNSGGPMFDMNGRVIAMNSAKVLTAGYDDYGNAVSSEGIGFALPINDVISIANRLIHNGSIMRPGIGITVYTLDEKSAELEGLVPGVFVNSVTEGAPAYNAGLQAGDVIVSLNGEKVLEKDIIVEYMKTLSVGDTVHFTVFRDKAYLDFDVIVGDMNQFK